MRQSSGELTGQGGIKLFYKLWEPDHLRGNIVLSHGAGEHTGRYEHVATWLCEQGFAVWAIDHRGHGRSEGLRMHLDRFDHYTDDLHTFIKLATENRGKPILIGHSMGGLIAYRYAVAHGGMLTGLVLSSPWFRTKMKLPPVAKALAPVVAAIAPKAKAGASIPPEYCTRNRAMLERDAQDPLIGRGGTVGWFMQCSRAQEPCFKGTSLPPGLPVLFMQAGEDKLADPDATREVFERMAHSQKSFKLYPEKYHEIFNDPGYEEVFSDLLDWIEAQDLAGPKL